MKFARGHLALGGGGMYHGAAADADACVIDTAAGIALEEHEVSGLQIVHGADQLPAALLGIALGALTADAVTALLHAVIHEAGAIEGVRALRAPFIRLAQLVLSGGDDAGIRLFTAG